MTLGEKLTKARKEHNYTQEQLADLLGVTRQSVSRWESDLAYPETEKLLELGKLFDCSMDYLLKDEITDKNTVNTPGLSKTIMTAENKGKAKKLLKIALLIFGIILAIDVLSLVIYFFINGIPG